MADQMNRKVALDRSFLPPRKLGLAGNAFYKALMRLPREVREQIWTHVLRNLNLPKTVVLRRGLDCTPVLRQRPQFPMVVPAICYTNRQICYETLPLFLQEREVVVGGSADVFKLSAFLNRIPGGIGYLSIRSLCLEEQVQWRQGDLLCGTFQAPLAGHWSSEELLALCTGLEHVEIERFATRVLDITYNEVAQLEIKPRSRASILRDFDPKFLLVSSSLRSVKLRCVGAQFFTRTLRSTKEELFAVYTGIVRDALASRPEVRLEVEYITEFAAWARKEFDGWAKRR